MQWRASIWLAIATICACALTQAQDDRSELWDAVQQVLEREVQQERDDGELVAARLFLSEFDRGCQHYGHLAALYGFNYETNVTRYNADKLAEVSVANSNWGNEMLERARSFTMDEFDADMKRMFRLIRQSTNPRDINVQKKLENLGSTLIKQYASARVCDGRRCYSGETDLVTLFADTKTDYDTLLWAWKAWRDATGPASRHLYAELVHYMNIGARDNGYPDMSVPWMIFEMDDPYLNVTSLSLWDTVRPFYEELHAYVRHRLAQHYPGKFALDGPIPEHLLGNVWGQEWDHIYPLMVPYPDVPLTDVTAQMLSKNFTVEKIFTTAESFFSSIGMPEMTTAFWERSLLADPRDGRVVQCHASAVDMMDVQKQDFRVKMCTTITDADLMTAHHEMGHVEYYMMYKDQPCIYKSGANAAFHEAVGDTMQLSAKTPEYLYKIGLAPYKDIDGGLETQHKRDINFLLRLALSKVAFLPYGLMIDHWRWAVFRGATTPQTYNHDWWLLRVKFGGVMPPIDRSENDFDPGSKYHVASNTRYIRYFFSFLLQFQFHRSLCETKGHEGPIHRCNIYGSKAAGRALMDMLSLGESRPWRDALHTLTGQRYVDPSAILDYFKPLHDWLKATNQRNGVIPGWTTTSPDVKW